MSRDIGLLGNYPVSQVAGRRCTLLAGNSSINLGGSEEQINFSLQSSKMLKMASEIFIHSLLLLLGLFLKISRSVLLIRVLKDASAGSENFLSFSRRMLNFLNPLIYITLGQSRKMTSLLCSVQISREQVHEDKYLMFQSTNEQ